ncbi:hypothetical protein ACFPP6_36295 [Streptomyces aureoversilis]|uniref:Uncharacterized protein n=1 Tax=Streptomyces aureoversilis TaxID=67277 RepID=A0ABW0ACG0_9ACTN
MDADYRTTINHGAHLGIDVHPVMINLMTRCHTNETPQTGET